METRLQITLKTPYPSWSTLIMLGVYFSKNKEAGKSWWKDEWRHKQTNPVRKPLRGWKLFGLTFRIGQGKPETKWKASDQRIIVSVMLGGVVWKEKSAKLTYTANKLVFKSPDPPQISKWQPTSSSPLMYRLNPAFQFTSTNRLSLPEWG